SHALRDVPGLVVLHQVVGPTPASTFPPPRTVDRSPSTLPAQRSTFVGRQHDVDVLRRLLLDHRLVTLTGPGGTGKTRLAIEVAGREGPRRPGGTYFADLAALDDGDHVAAAVARACLAPPDAGRAPMDQLLDALADHDALVVLDNCEHVLDAAAEVTDRVLDSCPRTTVLATSREALDLAGEHVHVVEPLEAPGPDARTLFLERAVAVGGTTVDLTGEAIDELCSRVDGIPLAIELAAARTRALTPAQIVERLDERFDVLTGARRGTPERQQTLRATIDWSYDLLDPAEQRFFEQLAVFTSSFDLDAAASLGTGDTVRTADLLDSLVAKSMVTTEGDTDQGLRFRLLDSLQAYADERLRAQPGPVVATTAAHAWHFLTRLATVPMHRTMGRDACTRCVPDLDNFRLALVRSGSDSSDPLFVAASLRFVPVLVNLGLIGEARRHADQLLATDDLDGLARGQLLTIRAYMDATEDGSSGFAATARDALVHLQPGDGVWSAAIGLTSIPQQMFVSAEIVPVLAGHRERLEGLAGAEADFDRATIDFYLAGALMNLRRFDDATEVFLRSAATMAALDPTSLVRLWSAAGAAIGQTLCGRPEQALATLDEVAALVAWTDWGVEWAFARAFALAHCGPLSEARAPLCAVGARLGPDRPSPLAVTVVAGFGVLAALEGREERAAELFESLTAARSAASTAAAYEVLGRLEGWGADEFAHRKIERVILAAGRQEEMTRAEYFARMNALAHEEAGSG
ncbi:MAG: ATP-binding protein, partial [Acidimicrobiales bacterium]